MTYTIERRNDVGPDELPVVRFLGRYCSLIAKPIIFNWSINQYDNITEQLNGGIRYLDLRLATKSNDEIHFLHGLYGAEITRPLQDVADWLSSHPNEVVILDFQHFYAFTERHHRSLIDKIRHIFRDKMCPIYGKFDHLTLEWLSFRKYQVFVVYRNIVIRNYTDLWPSGLWPTPWPNTVSTSKLLRFLDSSLQSKVPNIGFVSQCLLTPSVSFVVRHLCGNLHRSLGNRCRSATLSWIQKNHPGTGGMNIVITDYVSVNSFLFSKLVIQRNVTLLDIESSKSLDLLHSVTLPK